MHIGDRAHVVGRGAEVAGVADSAPLLPMLMMNGDSSRLRSTSLIASVTFVPAAFVRRLRLFAIA